MKYRGNPNRLLSTRCLPAAPCHVRANKGAHSNTKIVIETLASLSKSSVHWRLSKVLQNKQWQQMRNGFLTFYIKLCSIRKCNKQNWKSSCVSLLKDRSFRRFCRSNSKAMLVTAVFISLFFYVLLPIVTPWKFYEIQAKKIDFIVNITLIYSCKINYTSNSYLSSFFFTTQEKQI